MKLTLNTKRTSILCSFVILIAHFKQNVKRNVSRTENATLISREKNANRTPIKCQQNANQTELRLMNLTQEIKFTQFVNLFLLMCQEALSSYLSLNIDGQSLPKLRNRYITHDATVRKTFCWMVAQNFIHASILTSLEFLC